MEKDKTILLKGSSEHSYVFNVYPWKTMLVCSGVVYVVLRRNRFGCSVLYVGNVRLLKEHTTEHPLRLKFDKAGCTHIGVHVEPSELMRKAKEKDLVTNLLPVFNMKRKYFS